MLAAIAKKVCLWFPGEMPDGVRRLFTLHAFPQQRQSQQFILSRWWASGNPCLYVSEGEVVGDVEMYENLSENSPHVEVALEPEGAQVQPFSLYQCNPATSPAWVQPFSLSLNQCNLPASPAWVQPFSLCQCNPPTSPAWVQPFSLCQCNPPTSPAWVQAVSLCQCNPPSHSGSQKPVRKLL